MDRLSAMIRSLLFYLLFYSGTVLIVIVSAVALLGNDEQFRSTVDLWDRWHRG